MGHTDNGRRRLTARRRLRTETPSTVAVLADEKDFAAMRRYTSFLFDDHAGYLRDVDGLLRSMAARGTYTTVALFDPVDYEEYCTDLHLDPDTAASRTRYTAEVAAAGATVAYDGRPLASLLPRLIDEAEQQATWEYASALLARGGDCASCGEDLGRAAFALASRALRRIIEAVGEGSHHLVCSVQADGDTPLVAVVRTACGKDGRLHLAEAEALVFCTVLAAGIVTDRHGGVVLRTTRPGGPDTVRGWGLKDGGLRPLTEAEVFAAYCTDATTGEPVPPEPGIEYRAGIPLDGELDGDEEGRRRMPEDA
ncbi:nuclear transport factor 2 family protein [Streptomyces sp. SCA3-4]|uniref:nuclear transport factor 2 family protein n=1 Tax=Streptomyces sichuanensis TaxID=2871810 RepID=UPI001CE2E7E9|nr:nuclear transport factor 2 family protein [Streptomyces sichuanensis]MCA6096266.1 nuclear transport factor 2 family protein [Streptomyces sichuanensis]